MSGGGARGATITAAHERFAEAHRALRADGTVQFVLPPATPAPPPPAWLKAFGEWLADLFRPVGRLLRWIGSLMPDAPFARILLWSVLAFAAAVVLWLVTERLRGRTWRLRRRNSARIAADEEAWQPEAAPARALLREADALAEVGDYAEAVHLLLHRSIEDIRRRRPQLVRPALTSRDIAAAPALPYQARSTFTAIAEVVERSLFGGAAVDAADWAECRRVYADFALPKAWA